MVLPFQIANSPYSPAIIHDYPRPVICARVNQYRFQGLLSFIRRTVVIPTSLIVRNLRRIEQGIGNQTFRSRVRQSSTRIPRASRWCEDSDIFYLTCAALKRRLSAFSIPQRWDLSNQIGDIRRATMQIGGHYIYKYSQIPAQGNRRGKERCVCQTVFS